MENIASNEFKKYNMVSIIYVSIILGVFPLIFHDYYYDILIFKYKFYYVVTLLYVGFILINNLFDAMKNKKGIISFKDALKKVSIIELSILVFMIIAIISTIQSDYLYESFWGNEGRYTGCFTLLLYGTSILLIKKYLHFKNWLLYLFLIAGTLACLLGITDYFKLDLLRFKVSIDPTQYNMFMSTIGNVNTYTSYVALIMAVATVLFTTEKVYWKTILYYLCMTCAFFAMIMGLSDNSYLAVFTLFGLLPLYLFKTKTGLRRYLVATTTFIGVIYLVVSINKSIPDKVLEMQGILHYLSVGGLEIILLVLICITAVSYGYKYLSKSDKENLARNWKLVWLILLLLIAGLLLFMLYDVNILHSKRYGALSQYLLFNDDWGTHRGYNWKIGMQNYLKFPLVHKIFGYGPDTYGVLTHFNNLTEMTEKYNETYDSVHNEYLQYFITMGPLSLISYLVFLVASIVSLIKKTVTNVYAVCVIFAVLCYSVQAFVNISVPIVTPIVFVLLASALAKNDCDFLRSSKENH